MLIAKKWTGVRAYLVGRLPKYSITSNGGAMALCKKAHIHFWFRVLNPASPQARSIFDLGIVSSIIFAVIFVIVAGIIVYVLMRFRWREGEPRPASTRRQTRRWRSSGP